MIRLVSLVDEAVSEELLCEAVVTLGSFGHGEPPHLAMIVIMRSICVRACVCVCVFLTGTADTVEAVVDAKALPVLANGTIHACIYTHNTITGLIRACIVFRLAAWL